MPDPAILGNAGSFFKNPIVEKSVFEAIKNVYPDVVAYADTNERMKIAAGWLIDKAGWKGRRIGDAGVHTKQALVLVNYGKASGRDIYNLAMEIKADITESSESNWNLKLILFDCFLTYFNNCR